MIGLLILAILIGLAFLALKAARLDKFRVYLRLNHTNTNWRHEPKAVYRDLYWQGIISRDGYEQLASDVDGSWVN